MNETLKNILYVIFGIVFVFAIYFSYMYFQQIKQSEVSSQASPEKIQEIEDTTKEVLTGDVVSVDQKTIKLKVGDKVNEIKIDDQTKILKSTVSDDLTNTFSDSKIEDISIGSRGSAFLSNNTKTGEKKVEKFQFMIPKTLAN